MRDRRIGYNWILVVARFLAAIPILVIVSLAIALFNAFVHIPSDFYPWGLVGRGSDPMNLHRLLVCLPGALVLVTCGASSLTVALRRGKRMERSRALLRSALAMSPLVLLAPVLRYPRYHGRVYLAAVVVASVAYIAWPLVEPLVRRWWRRTGPRLSDPWGQKLYGVILATVVAVFFFVLGWLRHRAMWSSLIDLGLFYQLFDHAQGGLLFSPTLGHSFLGEHFSPSLVLLWPIMKLLPSPVTLIAVQAVSIGLGGYLLYLYARERTGHFPLSLAIMICYMLAPQLQQAALYDFHMDLLEPPMLFGAMLALQRRKDWAFIACCVLLWTTKEDTFLYTSVIAVHAMIHHRRWVLGSVILVVGLAQGYLVTFHLLPHLRPEASGLYFRTTVSEEGYAFLDRYGKWGTDQWEIALSLLTRPHQVIQHLFTGGRLPSMMAVLLGFGGLALASRSRVLLLLPVLEILLSESYEMSQLMFYYGATVMMIAAVPAVEGAAVLRERREAGVPPPRIGWWTPARMTLTLLALIVALLTLHPRSYLSSHHEYPSFIRTSHHQRASTLMDGLVEGERVTANGYLAAQMMSDHPVRMFPFGLREADVVLLDLQRPPWPVDFHNVQSMAHFLVAGGKFDVVEMQDGLLLLRKASPVTPSTHVEREAVKLFLDELVVEAELTEQTRYPDRVVRGDEASNGAFIRVGGGDARGPGHVIYGPFARMSGGTYRMKTRLRWCRDFIIPLVSQLPVVTLDVVRRGGRVAASRTLSVGDFPEHDGAWRDVHLDFEATRWDGEHEFRVFYHDLGQLDVDVVTIERISP